MEGAVVLGNMGRTLVLVSLVSLATGQHGLLSITQHPRDTHVAPGGTVSFRNIG